MTRAALDYSARRATAPAIGFDADEPIEGYYATRLRFGAIRVGVRIFYGPPSDPVTGEELDRSWRWQAHVNGRYVELDTVWPKCAGDPIDEAEYRYLCRLQRWGEQHAPDSPQADPTRCVDPLQSPILF